MQASSSLGVTLQLSPEVAAALRQQGQPTNKTESDNKNTKNDINNNNAEEDTLPFITVHIKRLAGFVPDTLQERLSIKKQLIEALWKSYEEDNNIGNNANNDTTNSMMAMSIPPPNFDEHVSDLIASGISKISIVESKNDNALQTTPTFQITYPPKLLYHNKDSNNNNNPFIETKNIVKELHSFPNNGQQKQEQQQQQEQQMDFIKRLFYHLLHCNRNLIWKYEMKLELNNILKQEQDYKDWMEWNANTRTQKLQHLYSVQETLLNQLDMHQTQLDTLQQEQEHKIQHELQKLQNHGLDFEGGRFMSFPSEFQLLKLNDSEDDEDDPYRLYSDGENDDWNDRHDDDDDDDYSNDSYSSHGSNQSKNQDEHNNHNYYNDDYDNNHLDADDEGGDDEPQQSFKNLKNDNIDDDQSQDSNTQFQTIINDNPETKSTKDTKNTSTLLPPAIDLLRRKRRHKKRSKKSKQKNAQDFVLEQEHDEKLQQAREQEQQIRQQIIATSNPSLKMSQAIVQALQDKIDKVDELLTILEQEEYEAAATQASNQTTTSTPSSTTNFSLLDQILAMILGQVLPKDNDYDDDNNNDNNVEHFKYIQKEHESIVREWNNYFGRLPPAAFQNDTNNNNNDNGDMNTMQKSNKAAQQVLEPLTVTEKRLALGIMDNTTNDWEDDLDDDDGDNDIIMKQSNQIQEKMESLVSKDNNVESTKKSNNNSNSSETKPRIIGLRPGGKVKK